jgi:hypothetical protein
MRIHAIGPAVLLFTSLAMATVTVTSPTNGSTVSAPVQVTSTSSSSHGIVQTIVYVDNKDAYKTSTGTVNTSLTLATGSHTMVVQSWDSSGVVLKSSAITFNVATSTSGVPTNAKKYTTIEQMTGWQSCDTCAGAGGSGPTAVVSMTQNVTSPSLDSKSAQFYLKGSQPYSGGLWWKQLGANSAVSSFQYDLYFYLKNPSAAQALEFDVNQSINGKKYIFGTECDVKDHHAWNIYDAANHKWMGTGIACTTPIAYAWNHLTLEFQRVNGQMKFVAVTLNGKKSYFNRSYYAAPSGVSELNVAVQIDTDGNNTAYSEWVDKITLSAW